MRMTFFYRAPGLFGAAALLAILFPINSNAQTIPCSVASSLGERIYVRVIASGKRKNLTAVYEGSRAFWDVREFAASCNELRKIGDELEGAGMGKGAAPPTQAELAQSLISDTGLTDPLNCLGCKILLKKPAKGNFAGMRAPDKYYEFNASNVKDGETPWKELATEKVLIGPSMKDVQIIPGSLKSLEKN